MRMIARRGLLVYLTGFALILTMAWMGPAPAATAPFEDLTGVWTGTGTARFDDGTASRVRCKATYNGRGVQLDMIIYCSSGRHIFEIESRLTFDNGKLSGLWRENIRSAGGEAFGRVTGSRFALRIGGSVQGSMQITQQQSKQTVRISIKGLSLTGVNISLSRR